MGKFLVKSAKNGFKFNLIAGNGEPIGTSEVYSSKAACLKGVESVRKAAAAAAEKIDDLTAGASAVTNPKFEVYNDKGGEFRFRLKASNGENLLASEGYTSKASCKNGIASVVKNAADSPVAEEA